MLAAEIQKTDLQLVIHAVGDAAVSAAVTAVESTSSQACGRNLRNRIEQAAVLNGQIVARMKEQNLIVSIQPRVIASEFSVWNAIGRLGMKRARWFFPIKTLIENGICVVAGSDCPMEPLNPLSGIQALATRKLFSQERVSVDEALFMYTINAAYASHEEELKGSIEKGKLADITVLTKDPRKVPLDEIEDIAVEMTILNGRVVHQKPG
jgi:hypothetical protein